MSLYNIINPSSIVPGQPEDVSQVLANFQAIQAVLNGGIDDANIRATAAINPSKLLAYPADVTQVLRGDGSWGKPPGTILASGIGRSVSTSGTNYATGMDYLASDLSFTADGTSQYMVSMNAPYGQINFAGVSSVVAVAALDHVGGNSIVIYSTVANQLLNINGFIGLGTPTAGVHTVNIRIYGGSGSIVTVPPTGPVFVVKMA